jgi:CheY-like chemotaxis protein
MRNAARILVVDDDAALRSLCVQMLQEAGYEARSARNGREAVENTESYPLDLVLMDIMMPAMDGLAACKAIKANPRTRDLPVIIMSAVANLHMMAPDVIRVAAAVVSKPFDVDHVLETVDRVLAAQRSGSPQNESLR